MPPEPFAQSRTIRRPGAVDRPGETEPVRPVALEKRPRVDAPAELGVSDPAELLGPPDQLLELILDVVVELEALLVEHLEAVVVGGVVGSRDHDPGREVSLARQEGEGGRRDDAHGMDVDAEAGRAGGDRGDEHVARSAGVLADDEGAARTDEPARGRTAERVGEGGLQVDVRDATDPVRAEESGHRLGRRRWRGRR